MKEKYKWPRSDDVLKIAYSLEMSWVTEDRWFSQHQIGLGLALSLILTVWSVLSKSLLIALQARLTFDLV